MSRLTSQKRSARRYFRRLKNEDFSVYDKMEKYPKYDFTGKSYEYYDRVKSSKAKSKPKALASKTKVKIHKK